MKLLIIMMTKGYQMYQTALTMHKIIWRIHLIKIIKIIKIMEMIMPVCKKMNLNSEEIL